MVLTVSLLALGVFSLTNFVKSLVTAHLLPAAKLLIAGLFSAPGAIFYATDISEGVLLFVGTFGFATILHGAHKMLEAGGDALRASVLSRARR